MKRSKSIIFTVMVLVMGLIFIGCELFRDAETPAIINFAVEGQGGEAVINTETKTIYAEVMDIESIDVEALEITVLEVADFVEQITTEVGGDIVTVDLGVTLDFSSEIILYVKKTDFLDTEWTVVIEQKEFDIVGQGTEDIPFVIYTLAGLEKVGTGNYPLDAYYQLGDNIDATVTQDVDYNAGTGWEPLGEFTGNFNGQGYEITGLHIKQAETDEVGLFSKISGGATVSNLTLSAIDIDISANFVGALAGSSLEGIITDITLSGGIKVVGNRVGGLLGSAENTTIEQVNSTIDVNGFNLVGGLVGYFAGDGSSEIKNININAEVTVNNNDVGGLIGAFTDGNIIDVHISGQVTGGVAGPAQNNAGGLVGNFGSGSIESSSFNGNIYGGTGDRTGGLVGNLTSGLIKQSFVAGKVDGQGRFHTGGLVGDLAAAGIIEESFTSANVAGTHNIGGLVGNLSGKVKNSYALGDVSGHGRIGGLVGMIGNEPTIENCYAVGLVQAVQDTVGGLIGLDNSQDTAVVINSYWDKETTGQNDSAGDFGTGQTTENMQQKATFEPEWDFENIWSIDEGVSYPVLQW